MRSMALDLGDQYIGIALSDTLGMIARPYKVMKRTSRVNDFKTYQNLIEAFNVQAIIVGLPINMDGTEGKQARWVRDYMADFQLTCDTPVVFWDERLSTETAVEILNASGKQTTHARVDAVAAAVILQSYLDAHAT